MRFWLNRLMASPLIVLPELPAPRLKPLAPAPAEAPFSSTTGLPAAHPGAVVASMVNCLVIVGSAEVRLMVPATVNRMVSPAAAEVIALRSEPAPVSLRLLTVMMASVWS